MISKPWLQSYPKGVPATIDVRPWNSVTELLLQATQKYADKTAFTSFDTDLSYRELDQKSQQLAAFLLNELHLKKGDRVAIMLPNLLQYPIAMLGILRAGLIAVNVNPLYTERELAHQLADAEAETILVIENFVKTLEAALPHTTIKNIIITEAGDCLGALKGSLINFVVKYVRRDIPSYHLPNAIFWKDIFKKPYDFDQSKIQISAEDTAFLQYTGGTTGLAKGAELTHANLVANVAQCIAWMRPILQDGQEVITGALPLYHVFSLTVCCFCFLSIGGHSILISDPRDLKHFVRTLKKHSVSIFIGLNTLFRGLLTREDFCQLDFSKLKLTIAGGMPTNKTVADAWQKTTGVVVTEGYGLTEASPVVCINPMGISAFNGTIGLPIPNTEVILRDGEKMVAPGERGELCVRGPQVMKDYWHHTEETKHVLDAEGWLATGDVAIMNEQGFFTIVDRLKDLILVSGFKVFPSEVESVLDSNPRVLESAAIAVPDDRTGQAVKVFVVAKDKTLTSDEVIAFCRENLTGYKIPKYVEFRDNLPKSNVGKILRRELK